jgi:hypothetical protein
MRRNGGDPIPLSLLSLIHGNRGNSPLQEIEGGHLHWF